LSQPATTVLHERGPAAEQLLPRSRRQRKVARGRATRSPVPAALPQSTIGSYNHSAVRVLRLPTSPILEPMTNQATAMTVPPAFSRHRWNLGVIVGRHSALAEWLLLVAAAPLLLFPSQNTLVGAGLIAL